MQSLQTNQLDQSSEEPGLKVLILRLIAKLIPIVGESVTSEWQAQMAVFYPLLTSKVKPVHMAVLRCLLVMVTIDASIGEDLLVDLVRVLTEQVDEIEKTQLLEVEKQFEFKHSTIRFLDCVRPSVICYSFKSQRIWNAHRVYLHRC